VENNILAMLENYYPLSSLTLDQLLTLLIIMFQTWLKFHVEIKNVWLQATMISIW